MEPTAHYLSASYSAGPVPATPQGHGDPRSPSAGKETEVLGAWGPSRTGTGQSRCRDPGGSEDEQQRGCGAILSLSSRQFKGPFLQLRCREPQGPGPTSPASPPYASTAHHQPGGGPPLRGSLGARRHGLKQLLPPLEDHTPPREGRGGGGRLHVGLGQEAGHPRPSSAAAPGVALGPGRPGPQVATSPARPPGGWGRRTSLWRRGQLQGPGPPLLREGLPPSLGLWVSCTQLTSVVCLCQNSPSTCPQKIGRLPQSCGKADSRGAAALWPSGLCVEAEGRAAPGPGEPTFA